MKKLLISLYVLFCSLLYAQTTVIGTTERIDSIQIGNGPTDAFYYSNEEGFYSLGSPIIDRNGKIVFLKSFRGNNSIILLENEIWESFPYQGNLSNYRLTGNRHFNSQQGIQIDTTPLIYTEKGFYEYNYRDKSIRLSGGYYTFYPAPFGGIYYSEKEKAGIAIVFNIINPNEIFLVISQDDMKSWLPSQPGGFSIGNDGLLYRNGILWSAIPPNGYDGSRYMGKLASGHNIWASGDYGMESWFILSNSKGDMELEISFPWALEEKFEERQFHNYGVGPYGEFYCLITPKLVPGLNWPEGSQSELVVVRNHLKYFGRLNDGGVRLRSAPNTSGQILGSYPEKTGFRILERNGKIETIAGMTSDWVKVRLLDGTEGWFFGAFVHNLYDGPNGNPPPWPNVPDW